MTAHTVKLNSVHHAIEQFGDNPSGFLALNSKNHYFSADGLLGVVAYRQSGRFLVQFGGPFAAEDDYHSLLRQFLAFAQEQGRSVVAVQLQRTDADVYAEHGFTVNQVGASYALNLAEFTTRGTQFMQLRNKIARAHRSGLTVIEAKLEDWSDAIHEIDQAWLASKGEHAKPLEFLVGEHGGPMQDFRRLFLGRREGNPIGYISYSPVYGSRSGWLHDLSRRVPGNLPGIMEAINSAAIETFRSEAAGWLHFGFTPFTSLRPEFELPGHSRAFTWFMQWLSANGSMVYPAETQLAYKSKWAPHAVISEYVAFQGKAQLSGFIHVFKAANAI
jgi:lysylphosphatidylglycerol synthetase-like protein (DUF2156 family)